MYDLAYQCASWVFGGLAVGLSLGVLALVARAGTDSLRR